MISSTLLLLFVVLLIGLCNTEGSNVVPISPNVQVDENSGVTINMFYVEGEGSLSLELKIKNREEQYYIIVSTEDGSVQLCDKLFSVANGDNVQCSYDKNILKHGDNQFLITIFSVDKKKIVLRTSAHFYYEGYVIHGVEVQPSDFIEALNDNKELLIGGVLGGAAAYGGYRYWRQRSVRPPLPSASDISRRLESFPPPPVVVNDNPYTNLDPPPSPPKLLLTSPPMPLQIASPKTKTSGLTMPLILTVSGVAAAVSLGMRAVRTLEPLRLRPAEAVSILKDHHNNHHNHQASINEFHSDRLHFRFNPVYDFPSYLFDNASGKVKGLLRALRGRNRGL